MWVYNTLGSSIPMVESQNRANTPVILDTYVLYLDASLAILCDELAMPSELWKAHQDNDWAVMTAYRLSVKDMTESKCVAELLRMYQKLMEDKMAKFSFDFDVNGIMQSIEDELSEIIQSELESEENYMFQKLPRNSHKLLNDILTADNPVEMLQNRFETCSDHEDDELRGMIGELVEKGYIKVYWGDNVPYQVQIRNSARTYNEQLVEYERVLQAQGHTTNNYTFNNTNGIMVLGNVSDSTILFDALREKAGQLENEEEIKEKIDAMEQCAGKKSFVDRYNAFIQSIANHMTIFAPFIPMLTELFPKS